MYSGGGELQGQLCERHIHAHVCSRSRVVRANTRVWGEGGKGVVRCGDASARLHLFHDIT